MRICFCIGALAFLLVSAVNAQTSQVGKSWNFPKPRPAQVESPAARVETRDGLTNSKYLQTLEERMAAAGGVPSFTTRLTLGAPSYAFSTTDRKLYISAGLINQTANEAELAGLLAHLLAHTSNKLSTEQCVLAKAHVPVAAPGERVRELSASKNALGFMKATRYDRESMLDVLSKIAYQHPQLAAAISTSDLLQLRKPLEAEPIPAAGYLTDSREYVALRTELAPVEMLRMNARPAAK